MMVEKARLFSGGKIIEQIIQAPHPAAAKKLGRKVEGFNDKIWLKHRFDIVVKGNVLKFGQNPELKAFLLNTDQRVLVEASPFDKIWGIGLAKNSIDIENPNKWKGHNLLGFALMAAREQLKD